MFNKLKVKLLINNNFFMRFESTPINHIRMHHFKSFSPVVKSTQDEKRVLSNELNLTQVEFLTFF